MHESFESHLQISKVGLKVEFSRQKAKANCISPEVDKLKWQKKYRDKLILDIFDCAAICSNRVFLTYAQHFQYYCNEFK